MISLELNKLECKWGHMMNGYVFLLYNIARNMRGLKTILEIGVRHGTSTNAFLLGIEERKHPEKTHLYSIDIKDTSSVLDRFLGEERFNTLKSFWTLIVNDSKKVEWNKEVDVLFIDGNHTYEGAKADYERYMPFVKRGGIILIHDVLATKYQEEVGRFWREIQGNKVELNWSGAGMGIIQI